MNWRKIYALTPKSQWNINHTKNLYGRTLVTKVTLNYISTIKVSSLKYPLLGSWYFQSEIKFAKPQSSSESNRCETTRKRYKVKFICSSKLNIENKTSVNKKLSWESGSPCFSTSLSEEWFNSCCLYSAYTFLVLGITLFQSASNK